MKRFRLKTTRYVLLLITTVFAIIISPVNADSGLLGISVSNIVPSNPLQGDTVTISGSVTSKMDAISSLEYQLNGTSSNWSTCSLTNQFVPGDRDFSFASGDGNGLGFAGSPLVSAIQSDGKFIVGGSTNVYNGIARNNLVRINTDGNIDHSFDIGSGANNTVFLTKVLSNGKIVIGGFFTTYDGISRNGIAMLNSDGSLDTSFDPGTGVNGTGLVVDVVEQDDGKLVIGGIFSEYDGTARSGIARVNSDGSLDTSFDPGTGLNVGTATHALALQDDGKVILTGDFTQYNGTGSFTSYI